MNDSTDREAGAIEAVAQDYFLGMYEGDADRLKRIFDGQCGLFGGNKSGSHEYPLEGFVEQIGSGPAPQG